MELSLLKLSLIDSTIISFNKDTKARSETVLVKLSLVFTILTRDNLVYIWNINFWDNIILSYFRLESQRYLIFVDAHAEIVNLILENLAILKMLLNLYIKLVIGPIETLW